MYSCINVWNYSITQHVIDYLSDDKLMNKLLCVNNLWKNHFEEEGIRKVCYEITLAYTTMHGLMLNY